MQFMWIVLILGLNILFGINSVQSNKCGDETGENCDDLTSEYDRYRDCMEKRTKRSADCYDSNNDCGNCNCNLCENSASCNTCNSCCSQCCNARMCSSYTCCHEDCRRDCKSHACKTSCKKTCQEKENLVKSVYDGSFNYSQNIKNENLHNITTIIHLNNVINNTNLINLPISINNTVYNNITNKQIDGSYSYIDRQKNITENQSQNQNQNPNQNQKCCQTIGPRQCVSDKKFPFVKCFHIRKHVCGSICVAPIMHFEKHEICDNDVNSKEPCKEQTIFIPQPKPRCAYNPSWPYVNCGNNGYTQCEGCYNSFIKREDVRRCSQFCYDDGYGIGPYYRQGPFYRPEFSPVPSCYQLGTCPYPGQYPNVINYPNYGFNYRYPQNPYPQIPYPYPYPPPECENCSQPNSDNFSPIEPVISVDNENMFPAVEWDNVPGKVLKIDSAVTPVRSERYAEITIQSSDNATTTDVSKTKKTKRS